MKRKISLKINGKTYSHDVEPRPAEMELKPELSAVVAMSTSLSRGFSSSITCAKSPV